MDILTSPKRRMVLAFVIAAAAVFASVQSATAGPSTVALQAGGCSGWGSSIIDGSAGGGEALGCGGSSRYLSTTIIFADSTADNIAGAWYGVDIAWGNNGTGPHGAVTTAASTHNLAYIGNVNGYESTNTW